MYESFFGFDDTPFRLSADEKFRFEHENYLRASAYLAYALQQNEGFVMITGQPGSGKTTLVRDVVSEIDSSKFHVLNLVTSQLQAEELLRKVALEYGLPAETYNKATLLTGIHKHIAKLHEDGKQSILFLDEAQNLSTTGLEELRLLSNLQHGRNSLMQIVLIGHDELRSLVLGPGMEHIQQRLIAICQIKPMSPDQTRKYITHRLSKVGWRDDPQIQDDVFRLIHQAAQGVPRKINHLMSRLLLFAFLEEKHSLTEQDAFVVIEELVEENRITLSNGEDFEAFILRFQAEKEQLLVRQPEVVGLNVKQFKKQEEPLQVRGTGGVDQKVRSELATSTHIIAENLLLAIDESAQECEEAWDIPDSDWHNLESDLIAKKEISEKSAQVDRFTSNVKESIDKDLDDHDDSVEYQQPASLFSTDEIWDDKLDPKVDKSAHFDSLSDRRTGQFDPLSDLKMTDQASAEDDHQWGGVWWMSNQGGQGGERRSAADNYDSRPQRSERESGFVRHDKRSNTIQVDENLSMPSVWVDGCPEGVPRQNNEVHTFNPKPAGRGGIVRFLYYVISFVVIGFVVFLGLQFFPNAIDSYWRGVPSGADRP
jgi:type II secretory pathway predicted ATPase ExeA